MDIRTFIEPQQGATYDEQLAMACATEAAGLDGFFRSDHFLAFGQSSRAESGIGPTDAWLTLAGLARETSRIRLGTMLTAATFRHPGLLAIGAAQVDQMSGGRVEFGLGAGWYEAEHLAYGVPFPANAAERLSRLEEQLEIITGLWRTPPGGTFSYDGRYFQLREGPALANPLQSPSPPVIVGGRGLKKTPALAARFADEWNLPFQNLEQSELILASKSVACERLGRDPSTLICSVALTTVCAASEAEAARGAEAINQDPERLLANGLFGTPEMVAERLSSYAALGISRVYLQLLDLADLDQVAFIGRELAPLINDL